MERWRSIKGFAGYEVSDQGSVRSFRRGTLFPVILKPSRGSKDSQRRAMVTLYRGTKQPHYRLVARLVCEAFHGAPPTPQHQAAHDNGDCTNDSASNLFWKTPIANIADRARHGRTATGENHYAAQLNNEQVREIRTRHKALRADRKRGVVRLLATDYGVGLYTIEDIIYGRRWRSVA